MFGKCMICNGKEWKLFEVVQDNYEPVRFFECLRCGQVTKWPQLTPPELRYFNNHIYRWNTDLVELEKFEARRAEVQFHLIDMSPIHSMMDFGCSTGQLLHRFCKYWKTLFAVGIETNKKIADYARGSGLLVANDMQEIVPEARFDLITAVHVLEHLDKPGVTLFNMREKISTGGRLYVEVPNLLGDVALEKAHIHAFTEDTLINLLHMSGWEPIWIKKHGAPKHPWLECYISVLACKSNGFDIGVPGSPRGIKGKRKLAMLKRLFALATYRG